MADAARLHCVNCGQTSEAGTESWGTATHPTLGSITQCPECGSTNVQRER